MDPVALTAGERTDLLLLVSALEIEIGAIGARVHLLLAEEDHVVAAGNFLPDVLLAVEGVARLVHVSEVYGIANPDRALIGFLLARDHAEQCGLASPVGPDDAYNTPR